MSSFNFVVLLASADPSLKQARAAQSACAEENYSDDFENESYDSLTSHIMLKLFTASNSTVHMESGKSDDPHLLDRVEDVQVNDPMLNQLTQIERFTDSSGSSDAAAEPFMLFVN